MIELPEEFLDEWCEYKRVTANKVGYSFQGYVVVLLWEILKLLYYVVWKDQHREDEV